MHAEVGEDLRAVAVVAGVGRQPELEVGVDRVAAVVLQRVGAQLVQQPDPAALVAAQVDTTPRPSSATARSAASSCGAAVAAQRAEHVAGEALRVHPHEHVAAVAESAGHQRDVLGAVDDVAVADGHGTRRAASAAGSSATRSTSGSVRRR